MVYIAVSVLPYDVLLLHVHDYFSSVDLLPFLLHCVLFSPHHQLTPNFTSFRDSLPCTWFRPVWSSYRTLLLTITERETAPVKTNSENLFPHRNLRWAAHGYTTHVELVQYIFFITRVHKVLSWHLSLSPRCVGCLPVCGRRLRQHLLPQLRLPLVHHQKTVLKLCCNSYDRIVKRWAVKTYSHFL